MTKKYHGTFDAGKVRVYIISESNRTGFAHWFTPDAKVFNLPYLGFLSSEPQAEYRAMISKQLAGNDEVYDIVRIGTDMGAYAKKMSEFGITADKVFRNDTNVGSVLMVKLKPAS